MNNELIAELKEHLVINDDRTVPKRESRKIIDAVKRDLYKNHPDLVKKVEEHFGDTLYNVIKGKVIPFSVLKMVMGEFTEEHFLKHLLSKSKDEKIIIDFVEEKDFVSSVERTYDKWKNWEGVAETKVGGIELKLPLEPQQKIINTVLEANGIKASWKEIFDAFKNSESISKEKSLVEKDLRQSEKSLKEAKAKLAEYSLKAHMEISIPKVEASGDIPEGEVTWKKVKEVFDLKDSSLDFDVPVWEWKGIHPMVPQVDNNYIFREEQLIRVLYAIQSNQRMYLQGHTGSGKTTLIEQVAARLNYPFIRINFDSEITRMDLIGRETLVNQDGKTVSKFEDGLLPQMMSSPCIGCFDEIDFCRPDVAYVMQSVLEANALRLTEDGGREVRPHPMFRMFATGNTVGQGDEQGMYQGARPQSLAFLDRFTLWAKVPYLSEKERESLVTRHFPALDEGKVKLINKYVTEHLEGFEKGLVLQPISPRGMLAVARTVNFLQAVQPDNKNPVKSALTMVVLDRATAADNIVLKGIVDRVAK